MRPVQLDMDGFASFREPTSVDFTDAEYFALVGPTGAGKSTVIDAMTFALFGTVPRWDDRRVVRNALAPTANRGTVRLVFDVAGNRYVAAREVRRTTQGVQQKNARLERLLDPTGTGALDEDTDVLAADSGVTPAVEQLLGLSFEHFTQCVVLPQGEFAQFLRARGAERRATLLKLLGADLYIDIGKRANARAALAGARAQLLTDQLGRLGDATEQAQTDAETRVAELVELGATVSRSLPRLAEADVALTAARREHARLTTEHGQLSGLRAPDGLAELDTQLQAAAADLAATRNGEQAAEAADTNARQALNDAPARAPLDKAAADHADRDLVRAALPAARASAADADRRLQTATAAGVQAAAVLEGARTARDAADTAAQAAADLVGRFTDEIGLLRAVTVPAELPALDERIRATQDDLAATTDEQTAAEADEDTARAAVAAAPERLPLERALAVHGELAAAREAIEPLRAAHESAQAALAAAETTQTEAGARLAAAREHREATAVASGAAALRPHLTVGQPCPVCEQEVRTLPAAAAAPELAAADLAVAEAESALRLLQAEERAAARVAADAGARLDAGTGRVQTLTDALSGLPADPDAARAQLDQVGTLEQAAAAARERLRAARLRRAAAAERLTAAEGDAAALRVRFANARDRLVPLGAPTAGDGPLLAAWTQLADWAAAEATERVDALAAAEQSAAAAAGALAAARREFSAAESAATEARAEETAATGAQGSATTALRGLEARLADLDVALAGVPGPTEVAAALVELTALEAATHTADEALRRAREARVAAQQRVESLAHRDAEAWQVLRAARDRLVPLGVPELTAASVRAGWTDLLEWAGGQAADRKAALPAAERAVAEAVAGYGLLEKQLAQALTAAGVAVEDGPLPQTAAAAVAAAAAGARAEVARIAERRAEAADVTEHHAAAVSEQQVAKMLGNLLRSDKFPEWLETAALDTLVAAASESLAELSGGQFELTHRDGEFFVVDHADADSERSVRTLSGGETFQASLALALALSSQLSALAAAGAARLDSIFLDEGFGTLDETTLDVVAGTLENLASGQRMVGVITHVAALAERVPVRYVVRRDARTSTIVRESA